MAPRASIGRAELNAQIGARHAEAVIAPRVNLHIGRLRHVAFDALGAGRSSLVMMVVFAVVFARRMLMARRADFIALVLQPGGMWIVAIAAADILVIHFAFEERRVFIHFVQNL